jgi:hypothetical protein
MTFHRALLLRYELALLSVDPSIGALPYWDMALDSVGGKFRDDPDLYIFGENYFGSYFTAEDNDHQIQDGLFAGWPVALWSSERFGADSPFAAESSCIARETFKPAPCDEDDPNSDLYIRDHASCVPTVTREPDSIPYPFGGAWP